MRISRQLFFMVLGTSMMTVAVAMAILFLSMSQFLERQHEMDRTLLQKTLTRQYSQYGKDLLEAIEEAIINPMFLNDRAQIQAILSSFIGRSGVLNIYVFDTHWRVLVDGTEDFSSRGKHISDLFDINVEQLKQAPTTQNEAIHVREILINDEYLLGGIALIVDRSSLLQSVDLLSQNMLQIQREAKETQYRAMFIILPVIFLFSIGVSIFVAQYFSSPIKQVARNVQRLEAGNYKISLPIYRKDEIGDLARSTHNLARTLEENETFKGELISSVSHELRTPLTSVLGFAKLISRDLKNVIPAETLTDDSQLKKVRRIESNLDIIALESQRLTRLISNVLDLSKIESGTIEWDFTRAGIAEPLAVAARSMHGVFASLPKVKLTTDIPEDLPEIPIDRDRIEQVIVNLLSNAAKFTEEGSVHLDARIVNGAMVQVNVTDTGIGIPEHMQDQIFERFQQVAESGRMKHNGTGLGLAICKEIVEAHHGRIWSMQCTGGGSRFTFEIPINGIISEY